MRCRYMSHVLCNPKKCRFSLSCKRDDPKPQFEGTGKKTLIIYKFYPDRGITVEARSLER